MRATARRRLASAAASTLLLAGCTTRVAGAGRLGY